MMRQPSVSVIVPVYKVEPYLARCIGSLRAQTFPDIEIILVDDGSPDGCPAMCDAAAGEDPRIRVIHQENAGLSAARNAGIEAAAAPWLMFADSDDYVLPGFCARALYAVRESGADIAVFDFEKCRPDGTSSVPNLENRPGTEGPMPEGVYGTKEALCALACGRILDYAWNKIYRRELFENIRYPAGEIWEDIPTTCRLFARARKVAVFHEVLYMYMIRAGSLSKYDFEAVSADFLKMREREYAFLEKECPDAAVSMAPLITGAELDFCMYRCLDRKDAKCRAVRRRLLARRYTLRQLGFKMWVKTKCLRVPVLFWLLTYDRRRRMRPAGRRRTGK